MLFDIFLNILVEDPKLLGVTRVKPSFETIVETSKQRGQYANHPLLVAISLEILYLLQALYRNQQSQGGAI